jgi:hypothetical protein
MKRFPPISRLGKWQKTKIRNAVRLSISIRKWENSAMNTGKIGSNLSNLILSNATIGIFGVVVAVVMLFLAFMATSPTPYDKQVLGPLPEMVLDAEVAALPSEPK